MFMALPETIAVCVAYAGAGRTCVLIEMSVPAGCTAAQAVQRSGLLLDLPDAQVDVLTLGLRGRKIAASHRLQNGDRVEICRPLRVDPKLARRERFARQGAKSAGLFAKRRAGAKAGY